MPELPNAYPPGTALLLFEDPDTPAHLHLVLTEANAAGEVILVSITTRRAKSETLVCLDAGDHEFIRHPSVIAYAYSKIVKVQELAALEAQGEVVRKQPASPALLSRARSGMRDTDRAPREVQALFRQLFPQHSSHRRMYGEY